MRIKNAVVVITGASSGIGRATALAFAKKGARLVVAARRAEALAHVVKECEARGGEAMAVPVDVSEYTATRELARRATERFGRIDIWVNAAAVSLFSEFRETPLEDFRRVLDVNIMGYVNGARAALPYMSEQGKGLLVNISSITSFAPQPYATAYVMSKAAVTAFSASLRQELRLTGSRKIKVCTVMPAAIDTPLFQHAANYTGRKVQALPPVYTPERVARTIVRMARHPRPEVIVGPAGRAMRFQSRVNPRLNERVTARHVDRTHLSRKETCPPTVGNIYTSVPGTGSIGGGWHGKRGTAVRRLATATAAGATAAGVIGLRRRQGGHA
jgi:short-subunit dehydrogenase